MAYQTDPFVIKKWTKAMKAPSNSTPNYELIVTGLNANQKMVSEVLATMNKEMPDPRPYPFLSISSNKMTMNPAPMSWPMIRAIVVSDI